ncbi:MAG: hypothetical protein DBX91_01195 [Subdoligranulum variabile]|nr:MAG: hypothetical protein DBX91_01195 [Subdoligranulum variabile]
MMVLLMMVLLFLITGADRAALLYVYYSAASPATEFVILESFCTFFTFWPLPGFLTNTILHKRTFFISLMQSINLTVVSKSTYFVHTAFSVLFLHILYYARSGANQKYRLPLSCTSKKNLL